MSDAILEIEALNRPIEKNKTRTCLSGLSSQCTKTIYGTRSERICRRCRALIVSGAPTRREEKKEDGE